MLAEVTEKGTSWEEAETISQVMIYDLKGFQEGFSKLFMYHLLFLTANAISIYKKQSQEQHIQWVTVHVRLTEILKSFAGAALPHEL